MLKRSLANLIAPIFDVMLAPMVLISSMLMKIVRRLGIWRMPISQAIFDYTGVYPIRDHYYEPMVNYKKHLQHSLRGVRNLPGINLNEAVQLAWLGQFVYAGELALIPVESSEEGAFFYHNPNFSEGDAECLYSIVRLKKPKRIVEIGSGFSTMMARKAIAQNKLEDTDYNCRHICVEPFEMPWLDIVDGIEVIRQKVEAMDSDLFLELEQDDILFIDSSHIIRPQGDVLCEYLEILPVLKRGVLVHIHDIFTPRDYLDQWLYTERKLWNEQYLFESFLSCSQKYEIILGLNYLWYDHRDEMLQAFPMLGKRGGEITEPRSFWIRSLN